MSVHSCQSQFSWITIVASQLIMMFVLLTSCHDITVQLMIGAFYSALSLFEILHLEMFDWDRGGLYLYYQFKLVTAPAVSWVLLQTELPYIGLCIEFKQGPHPDWKYSVNYFYLLWRLRSVPVATSECLYLVNVDVLTATQAELTW